MTNIKILISYKNEHKLIKSEVLTPIQTGRAIADKHFDNMIGDDTGDNISAKNELYCEISAQYWAWKNYEQLGNPKYIGFMHYRRHFIFNNIEKYSSDNGNWNNFNLIDEHYLDEVGLNNDSLIAEVIDGNDILLPISMVFGSSSLRKQWQSLDSAMLGFKVEDFDLMVKTAKQIHPSYSKVIGEVLYQNTNIASASAYFCNMFIMQKEMFFRYNEFLFPILFELENKIDTSMYGANYSRLLGHFSERLLNVFIRKIELENTSKIKHLPVSYIRDTSLDTCSSIEPIFDDNYVPVVFCCDDYYVPYLMVTLQSLVEQAHKLHNYDIIIFTKNISEFNRNLLRQSFSKKNISIRFVVQNFNRLRLNFSTLDHISADTYSRLYIPFICKGYSKLVYLDADILICDDIYNLYTQNLHGKSVGVCIEHIRAALYNRTTHYSAGSFFCFKIGNNNYGTKEYLDNYLKIKESYRYFNAGVILFDLDRINPQKHENFISDILICYEDLAYGDQDILNLIFSDDKSLLDLSWNYITDHRYAKVEGILSSLPLPYLKEYNKARENPKIIHYAGVIKPWNLYAGDHTSLEFNHLWWQVARRTPLYEVIVNRTINNGNVATSQVLQGSSKELLKPLIKLSCCKLKVRKIRYKILSKIGFSKKYRRRYKEKINAVSVKIKKLRQLIKKP